jgi:hypothetical protein
VTTAGLANTSFVLHPGQNVAMKLSSDAVELLAEHDLDLRDPVDVLWLRHLILIGQAPQELAGLLMTPEPAEVVPLACEVRDHRVDHEPDEHVLPRLRGSAGQPRARVGAWPPTPRR